MSLLLVLLSSLPGGSFMKVNTDMKKAPFFGLVCRRLPSTSPDSLVNSIESEYRSMPLPCAWGKDNEDRAPECL